MVDDATSQTDGQFSDAETIWVAARVLRRWIETRGIPLALYTDWKNVYVRPPNKQEQATGAAPITQFGRMCAALEIQIIPASSPQAKGRIERNHGTHQDRLVKKLRRLKICDDAAANHFLEARYWPAHNARFAQPATAPEDFHRRCPAPAVLDRIFRLEDLDSVARLTDSRGTKFSPGGAVVSDTHYLIGSLRWSKDRDWMPNSLALLAVGAADTAVVFVHGFAGSADGTWERFSQSLRRMKEAASVDAFFVEYPSTTTGVPFCAAQFRMFLFDLLREPALQIVNGSLPDGAPKRPPGPLYGKILLVGHSMGAVVSRQALLELDRNELREEERARISMIFFAPAHKGARDVARYVATGFGLDRLPFSSVIGGLLRLRYRSVDDLIKTSDCLQDLNTASKALREQRRAAGAQWDYLRARVFHAHGDRVVYQDAFDDDQPMEPVMAQNHRSVCKPRAGYSSPEDAVRQWLR